MSPKYETAIGANIPIRRGSPIGGGAIAAAAQGGDASSLGGYVASEFARLVEDCTITGAWTFNTNIALDTGVTIDGMDPSAFAALQFLVLAASPQLSAERVLTPGDGLDGNDGGAGAAYTLSVDVTDIIGTGLTEAANNIILAWSGTPDVIQPDDSAAGGASSYAARIDHTHGIVCAAPANPSVDLSASIEGSATSFARSDHEHQLDQAITPTWTGKHIFRHTTQPQVEIGYDAAKYLSITVEGTDDVNISATGNLIKFQSSVAIQSEDYASQTTGWRVTYGGSADFRYLFTDELHAKAFICDLEQALAGGQIISKSVAVLAADFSLPAAGNTLSFTVESFDGFATFRVFVDGDIVRFRQFSRSGTSLTIADAWGTVTWDSTDEAAKTQNYSFTRSAGALAGTAAGVVGQGTLVLDYGTTGNGIIESTCIDGAMAENAPYSQIVTWTTHPQPSANRVVRTRLGNLNGIFGTPNEYGLFAGEGHNEGSGDQYMRLSTEGFDIFNLQVKVYDGADLRIHLEPTTPYLAIGAATAYGTGDGIWMGKDSGTYKFRVGGIGGARISWNGASVYVVADDDNYLIASGTTLAMYGGGDKYVELTNAGVLTLGLSTAEHVRISGTAFQIKDGATVYTDISGGAITVGIAGGDHSSVYIAAGVLSLMHGETERIGLTAEGVLTINDSDGGAVITLDAALGAEITKKLTMPGAASVLSIGETPPTASNDGTGIWIDRTGMYGLKKTGEDTVLHAKFDATTGAITAGAGVVTLDALGISVEVTGGYVAGQSYRLMEGATTIGCMYGQAGDEINDVHVRNIEQAGYAGRVTITGESPETHSAGVVLQAVRGEDLIAVLLENGVATSFRPTPSETVDLGLSTNLWENAYINKLYVGAGAAAGGIGAARLAIEGTNASVDGPHIQLTTATDDYPLLQILGYAHDNIQIAFDAFFDGAWKSGDAGSNFTIRKNADKLTIAYDTGIAVDDSTVIPWHTGMILGSDGGIHFPVMKTGTDQADAGAVEGELWAESDEGFRVRLGQA